MYRKLLALACFLVTGSSVGMTAAQADIIKNLEFSVEGVLPASETDIDFVSTAIEADLFSVSDGLLKQRTVGLLGGVGAQYAFPNGSLTGNLDASASFIMEARFRVIELIGIGAFIDVLDGTNRYSAFFSPNGVQLSDNTFIPLDDMSQFHTYSISSHGNSSAYQFLVDGELLAYANATTTNLNGFQWGVGGFEGDVDWDFVRFAQQPIPARGLSLAGSLIEGPLRPDSLGGREHFDVDGDGSDDFGVVGIGLDHTQGYVYQVAITGELEGPSDFSETVTPLVLDAIPVHLAIDPEGEDFQSDNMIDGNCGDGSCDGVVSDITCPVSITELMDDGRPASAVFVIEADGLLVGQTCTALLFVATERTAARGKGRKRVVFKPTACATGISDGGTPITDTVALNAGPKLFDGVTNALISGPVSAIQLPPIGCP